MLVIGYIPTEIPSSTLFSDMDIYFGGNFCHYGFHVDNLPIFSSIIYYITIHASCQAHTIKFSDYFVLKVPTSEHCGKYSL